MWFKSQYQLTDEEQVFLDYQKCDTWEEGLNVHQSTGGQKKMKLGMR